MWRLWDREGWGHCSGPREPRTQHGAGLGGLNALSAWAAQVSGSADNHLLLAQETPPWQPPSP